MEYDNIQQHKSSIEDLDEKDQSINVKDTQFMPVFQYQRSPYINSSFAVNTTELHKYIEVVLMFEGTEVPYVMKLVDCRKTNFA